MASAVHSQIAVFGFGACTAVGLGALATAAAVRADLAGMSRHPYMIDKSGDAIVVCRCPGVAADAPVMDRFVALAAAAADEAIGSLHPRTRCVVVLALPENRPGLPADLERRLCDRLRASLRIDVVDMRCLSRGHAAGVHCTELASQALSQDPGLLYLVGGVDSYIDRETLEWLDATEQLHSRKTTWGFCPGEGAAFCLLGSHTAAAQLGLPPLLNVLTAASHLEPVPPGTDEVCIAEGLSKAFRAVFAPLPPETRIDQTICDMNGEPYRADEYGFSVLRTAKRFADEADCLTPADCWGDVGAASVPLFTTLAAIAGMKRYALGPSTLVYASSGSGLRGAMVLQQP